MLQTTKSGLHKDAVLSAEGNDVGDGADSNEVEIIAEIESRNGSVFLQGVAEFEGDPCAAEVVEVCAKLRIHQCVAEIRDVFRIRFVVIEDDQVAPGVAELQSLHPGIRAAVNGHDQLGSGFPEATAHAGRA